MCSSDLNDIVKKVVALAKECGVPEKEIQTDHLVIRPGCKDERDPTSMQNPMGYHIRNSLMVTLSEVETVEQLIPSALAAGVTRLHGLDFQTTEFKKYREQARDLALKAAKEKAEKMSAVLGRTIGKPLWINEHSQGSYYYGVWDLYDLYSSQIGRAHV